MRTLLIFLLATVSTAQAAQKTGADRNTRHHVMSMRELHQWAISRTVAVVAGPNTPTESSGSGVWVSTDGYVATCWHVVENASEVQVKVAYPGV
jgi:S1-C subfamily serine protease